MQTIRIISAGLFLLALTACTQTNTSPMDKQEFWKIIEQARQKSGTDLDRRYGALKNILKKYPAEEVRTFGQISGAYIYAAEDNLLLWAACKVMEGYASDDTFIYFCCWLVSEGYDVYSAALKDPETLADTPDYAYHEFEMLLYAATEVYMEKTGREPEWEPELAEEQKRELLSGIELADDTPFRESEAKAKELIPQYLPRLVERFGYDHEKTMEELRLMREDPEALLEQLKQELLDLGMSEEEYNRIMETANQRMQ